MRIEDFVRGIVVSLAGVSIAGCMVGGHGLLDVHDTQVETRPLKAGGTFTLENTNGAVTVTTWKQASVRIEAEKSAASERRLKDIRIEITGEDDRVEVTTHLPHRFIFGSSGEVEYRVSVPETARVQVETVNGRVRIEGIAGSARATTVNGSIRLEGSSGELRAKTVNGSIRADYRKLDPEGHNHFSTTNGSVTLTLPPDAQGSFEASTVNGRIRTDFPLDVSGGFGGHRLKGHVGTAGGFFEISTVNGSVTIEKS